MMLMWHKFDQFVFRAWWAALALCAWGGSVLAADLRVLVHQSFDLPASLLQTFEREHGVRLKIAKAGDAGELLNKLILTRQRPIADVVFGIDDSLAAKALAAGVLDGDPALQRLGPARVAMPAPLVPVDYGYVMVNFDRAWFARDGRALPRTLDDLATPAYRGLLVVQHPATSSPGHAFLLATIRLLGEDAAFAWWGRMRANGLKVARGWSEAYYTDFSRNGGRYPLVLSYATSPAAEVHFAQPPVSEPPTGTLALGGAVLRQVEGAALVQGGGERAAALAFVGFLRSPAVQEQLQTGMWMYPVETGVARVPVFRHANEPRDYQVPPADLDAARTSAWVARWTQVVLK